MILRHREDRNRWEIYISPQDVEMDFYLYCWRTFGAPSLANGWDQHGGSYTFTNPEYVSIIKLKFGI